MRLIRRAAIALATLSAFLLVTIFIFGGRDQFWDQFGSPDLGPVDLEHVQRRDTPNDSLACPPGFCEATSDITPPVYPVSAQQLRDAFVKAFDASWITGTQFHDVEGIVLVAADDPAMTYRFIARTPYLRFPDTVVLRFISLSGKQSTLALYSRSKFGKGDFGTNRNRIARWLDTLSASVDED